MKQVDAANPYQDGELGTGGTADHMLLRQYEFPDTYDDNHEHLLTIDHDACMRKDHDHALMCIHQYTQRDRSSLDIWLEMASNNRILDFLKAILKADPDITWTGYRILGSASSLGTIWTLELFAKDPYGATPVYTGMDSPNVRGRQTLLFANVH
jgi:hypothetical protein